MSAPETPDMGDMLYARMDDAPGAETPNGASIEEALEATVTRAESPEATAYPVYLLLDTPLA